MENFLNMIIRNNDGSYQVRMSWIKDHPPLATDYALARKRLDSLMKEFRLNGYHDQYHQFFKEWLDEAIIEWHYLPHRHVLKANSATTKI